ncbi:transmembrane protein 215 [Sceloporus undulatus]|uniref:transmembrane protein 215 n=1 Tax=Sceloporus undulatus TaxID=8520 RepID=UPI001C4C2E4A|nr:transmembrane protein 215 [Sceloporus undulatus]
MRPDDINPRTGLVVALVSVFLVFGFMFTVSGIKGETLGDIPLLAIGPAICLPGIAAIALTRKTDGCTKWPEHRCCPPCSCCCRKRNRDKDALELLRTPSDLESGKGSCDELAGKAFLGMAAKGGSGGAAPTCAAITTIASSATLEGSREEEEGKGYLENCCPEMPGNVLVAEEEDEATLYSSAFQRSSPVLAKPAATTTIPTPTTPAVAAEEEDNLGLASSSDTIIVCSYKDTSSPYDRYCCYINPSEELCEEEEEEEDHEAIV